MHFFKFQSHLFKFSVLTTLLSNLRPTTRKSVVYNFCGWNFHIAGNRSCCRWQFYIAGMGILDVVCSCDLDLDPMTIYTNMTRIAWRYTGFANIYVKAFESCRQKDRQTNRQIGRHMDRETRPKLYTTQLRGWSINRLLDSYFLTVFGIYFSRYEFREIVI